MFALSRSPRFVGLALAAAIAVTAFQTAAFAGGDPAMQPTHRVAEVNAGDLNLTLASDRAELDARIRRAANRVCAPDNSRDLESMANQARCRAAAIASAEGKRDTLIAAAEARGQQARVETPGAAVN